MSREHLTESGDSWTKSVDTRVPPSLELVELVSFRRAHPVPPDVPMKSKRVVEC